MIPKLSFKNLWQACGIFPNNTWTLMGAVMFICLKLDSYHHSHILEHWFMACPCAWNFNHVIMPICLNLDCCHVHVLKPWLLSSCLCAWTSIAVMFMSLNVDSCHVHVLEPWLLSCSCAWTLIPLIISICLTFISVPQQTCRHTSE